MDPEIASFIFKFQNLCHEGKEAKLSFSSKNGKAIVNLNVQLGSIPLPPQVHHPYPSQIPNHLFRNGASRERRRRKRAEAQRIAAVGAARELSAKDAEVLKLAEQAENEKDEEVVEVVETANVFQEPIDEICSD